MRYYVLDMHTHVCVFIYIYIFHYKYLEEKFLVDSGTDPIFLVNGAQNYIITKINWIDYIWWNQKIFFKLKLVDKIENSESSTGAQEGEHFLQS